MLEHLCGFDAPHIFALDVQRDFDGCTASHVAVWNKQETAYEKLLELGADPTITNTYGHTAEDMLNFQTKHAQDQSRKNLIFLDLEFTSGFYEFEQEPKILEVGIVFHGFLGFPFNVFFAYGFFAEGEGDLIRVTSNIVRP